MRRLSLIAAVLFVVPLFGYDSPKEYDGSMAADGIEGTWRLIEVEDNGTKRPPNIQEVLVFQSRTYSSASYGEWSYQIDSNRHPHRLDVFRSSDPSPNKYEEIYHLDGDTLRIGGTMPALPGLVGFKYCLIAGTYKRVK
jgi:uncharacterized protein (TIGR03067 family)